MNDINENNSIINYNIAINSKQKVLLLTFEMEELLEQIPLNPVSCMYDQENSRFKVDFEDENKKSSIYFIDFPKEQEKILENHNHIWIVGLSERVPRNDKILFAENVVLESPKPKKSYKI